MKKLFYIFLLFPFLMVAESSYTVIVGPGMAFNPAELTIPYTGGNALLDLQLQGNYSVLNDAIPTFYLNLEGGVQPVKA